MTTSRNSIVFQNFKFRQKEKTKIPFVLKEKHKSKYIQVLCDINKSLGLWEQCWEISEVEVEEDYCRSCWRRKLLLGGGRRLGGRRRLQCSSSMVHSNFFFQFGGFPNRNVNVFWKALRFVKSVTNWGAPSLLRVLQPAIQKNFKNELRVVEPAMYFLKIFILRVVEPAIYFYKIFWLAGSTTRNVKILRKYIAGSTTHNVFEQNFTLRVVEPAICFENLNALWFTEPRNIFF